MLNATTVPHNYRILAEYKKKYFREMTALLSSVLGRIPMSGETSRYAQEIFTYDLFDSVPVLMSVYVIHNKKICICIYIYVHIYMDIYICIYIQHVLGKPGLRTEDVQMISAIGTHGGSLDSIQSRLRIKTRDSSPVTPCFWRELNMWTHVYSESPDHELQDAPMICSIGGCGGRIFPIQTV